MKGEALPADLVYLLEKPADEDVARLAKKYGEGRRRIVTWDQREVDYRREMEDPLCFGEVVLLVQDDEGRLAVVRGKGSPPDAFDLPTGIIEEGEGVEETAVREGYEETGSHVRIENLVAIYRVRVHFARERLERWFFVLRCTATSPSSGPVDATEIEEVRFVRLPEEGPERWTREEWWGGNWRNRILQDGGLL